MTEETLAASRRQFLLRLLKVGGLSAGSVALGLGLRATSQRPTPPAALTLERSFLVPADDGLPELVVAQGEIPEELVRRAFEALGGISRFVARGDVVVLKPNVAWDRVPQQAATTNPDVVAEVARLCRNAGARRVIVTDVTCNEAARCFRRSGIAEAAAAAGAELVLPEQRLFKKVKLNGEVLEVWPVLETFLAADKVINIPVAKHHSLTGVSLALKNWYGIIGGQRNRLHQRINESIVDLAAFMRPTVTILDAYRVLMRNGPTGGSLNDVALKKTVIASTDEVAIDAFAAKAYWDLDLRRLPYLRMAAARGLGRPDFESLRTRTIQI
jgi:uncharacterized protein (DUF362 family)